MKAAANEREHANKPQGGLKAFLSECCEQCKTPVYTNQSLALVKRDSKPDEETLIHSHCFERNKDQLLSKLKEPLLIFIASMEEEDVSDILQNVSRAKMVGLIEEGYSVAVMLAKFSYTKPKIEKIKTLCSGIKDYKLSSNVVNQILPSVLTLWPKAVITNQEAENHDQLIYSEEQLIDMLETLVKAVFDGINPAEKGRAEEYLELFLESWKQHHRNGASLKHLLVVLVTILKFPIYSKSTSSDWINKAIDNCINCDYDVESTLSVLREFHNHGFKLDTEKSGILHRIIDNYGHSKSWDWILGVAEALIELGAKIDIKPVPLEKVFCYAGLGCLDPNLLRKAFEVFSKNLKLRDKEGLPNQVLYNLYYWICSELTKKENGEPNFPIIKQGIELLLEQEAPESVPRFTVSDEKKQWTETPLHMICHLNALTRAQAFEIATLFLNRDPKLRDVKGERGKTPLHLFCQHWGVIASENEADTKDLLEQLRFFMEGAAADVGDDKGLTPLEYLPCFWGVASSTPPEVMTTAMKVLVEGGHNINASNDASNDASRASHVTCTIIRQWIYNNVSSQQIHSALKVLQELGAEFNFIYEGNTLLHYVVEDWMENGVKFEEAFPVIKFLLQTNVPLEKKNNALNTILHIICEKWLGYGIKVDQIQQVLSLLLPEEGKDNKKLLASENMFERTALLVVGQLWLRSRIGFEKTIEVLQFLKNRGASVKAVDMSNNNLLSYFMQSWIDSKNMQGKELQALEALFTLAPKIKMTVDNRHSTREDDIDIDKGNKSNGVTKRQSLNFLWARFPDLAYRNEKFGTIPLHEIFSSERSRSLSMVVRCQMMRKLIAHEFDIDERHPEVEKKRVKYWLRLKNPHGDTPVMAAIKECLGAKDFVYTEFRALLEDCFKNGAEINSEKDGYDTVLTLFFRQNLKHLSNKDIWNFVWFMKNQGCKFISPEPGRYRRYIIEAFIRANLEEAVPEFIEAWTFVHGLSGNDYLEVQCDGVTLVHIGARELNELMFSDFLAQCPIQVLAEIIEKDCQNKSNTDASSQRLAVVEQDLDKSQKQSLLQFCVRNNHVGKKNLLTLFDTIVGQYMLYREYIVRDRSDSNIKRKVSIPFELFHSNLYEQSRKQNVVDILTLYIVALKGSKKLDAMMRLVEWLREIDADLYRELNGWTMIQFFFGDIYDQSTFSPAIYTRNHLESLTQYSPFLTVGEKKALALIFLNLKEITPEYIDPNSNQWIKLLKQEKTVFSSVILARHYESGYLLGVKDPKKALEYYQLACTSPYSNENELAVAARQFARNKFLTLADRKQMSALLRRVSVYQYEENFKEAVVECCSYLQSCDDNYQAQLQGVDALLVMKNAVCEQQIQSARIVVTLNRLIRKELFNRSLIAKMLEEFGLRWLYCYEYKERWLFFSNGGSHRFSLIRAEIYLTLVIEDGQYFETLKNQFKQPTQENKECLDHVKELLKVISDPNNKDFPDFLRGSETLMGRVTQLQQLLLSAMKDKQSGSEESSEQKIETRGPAN